MPDLLFERTDARDFADVGRHGERQHVADDVEGARRDVARVDRFLHLRGPGIAAAEQGLDRWKQLAVRREQAVGRGSERCDVRFAHLPRHVVAELREVLIAARLRLSVPQALVLDMDGGELRDVLEADDNVAEVGDRGMTVLEVELLPEFSRGVVEHPAQARFDRIGRATVAGERVGRLLGGHRCERDDARLHGKDGFRLPASGKDITMSFR